MVSCATKHPTLPELACILNKSPAGHPFHLAMQYVEHTSAPQQVRWLDEGYRSPEDMRKQAVEAKVTIEKAAARVRQDMGEQDRPVLKRGQRKVTRLGQVANMLADNVGVWIDGHRLKTSEIGGSEGLKRLRELRDDYGWKIVNRPTATSTDQYMLVELPEELQQ